MADEEEQVGDVVDDAVGIEGDHWDRARTIGIKCGVNMYILQSKCAFDVYI